jgi:hypothetical protein
MEEDGRRWKKMEEDGRRWKKMEDDGRRWKKMEEDKNRIRQIFTHGPRYEIVRNPFTFGGYAQFDVTTPRLLLLFISTFHLLPFFHFFHLLPIFHLFNSSFSFR